MTEVKEDVRDFRVCDCEESALFCAKDCLAPGDTYVVQPEIPGFSELEREPRPREQTRKTPPPPRNFHPAAQRISLPPPNFIQLDTGTCCDRDDCSNCDNGWHKSCKFGCTLKY